MACIAVVIVCCLAFYFCLGVVSQKADDFSRPNRKFFIAAEEESWNYADPIENMFDISSSFGNATDTIYKKAVFREYADGSFVRRKYSESYLGILGPIIRAEVDEILEIHLHNKASYPVSLHAHGILYAKDHEGALYNDGTEHKMDDQVLPGSNYTYYWRIPAERGPTESDEDCILFAYHSHVRGDNDIHTGLIGPLLICKKGSLPENSSTISSALNEFVLLFLIFDEKQSWYADENIKPSAQNPSDESVNPEKETDSESHKMYSINGYIRNKLLPLQMCIGSKTIWHLMGMGNEDGFHSVTFKGHPLVVNGHRTDVVHLYPGKFVTALMDSLHSGVWSIKSEVREDYMNRMDASMKIKPCHVEDILADERPPSPRRKRVFHIAVEELEWSYLPSSFNHTDHNSTRMDQTDRFTFTKALYVEYEDEGFEKKMQQHPSRGFLGPTMRVEVGEMLVIHLLNNASRPYSLQSTAFVCENCLNDDDSTRVRPGENKTIEFYIREELRPTANDPQCITWRYFSDVDPVKDSYSGLNGILLTCRPGSLDDLGHQKYVNSEHSLIFANIIENESHYFGSNKVRQEESEPSMMHSINGFMNGTLPEFDLCLEGNNSLHIISIGGKEDMHVVHLIGNLLLQYGTYRETAELIPGGHLTVTVQPHKVGKFQIRSESAKDIEQNMYAWYNVKNCHEPSRLSAADDSEKFTGKLRLYYIAAVETEWEYAPLKINPMNGMNLTDDEDSEIFVRNDEVHIGSKYRKVVYREYTDDSFKTQKPRNSADEHLGLLGPVIKAEVGDAIQIHFKNLATRDFNIRPHGVFETTSQEFSQGVEPGNDVILSWQVPVSSGPSRNGFNCSNWMYYSSVDTVKDTNSGLFGPIVICKAGVLNEDGSRKDVDKEFSVIFTVSDENKSWYLENNIQNYCLTPSEVNVDDPDFEESNKIHGINGRLYGSLTGLSGAVGEKAAWYLMGLGSEIDLHGAHFHGLTAVEKDDSTLAHGHREDVVDLFPGVSRSVEMILDNIGAWLFHCHVDDHLKAGMFAFVTVHS